MNVIQNIYHSIQSKLIGFQITFDDLKFQNIVFILSCNHMRPLVATILMVMVKINT